MKQPDKQRLIKMKATCASLLQYLQDNQITQDQVLNEQWIQWTVTTPLYNIGEQAYAVSKEYQESHSEIPWKRMAGLRHRLVHNYEGTNWSIITEVLFNDLPQLDASIEELLKQINTDDSPQ